MPVAEAKMLKRNFEEIIPNITEWQNRIQAHVKSGRDLITPMGRHRRFHLITKENWDDVKKEALAFLPQATSSDCCIRAMARVRLDLRGSGAYIRNIVHDSILVDCPPDIADDVAGILDRRMVESAQEIVGDYVMFKTDTKIGKHWGEV
jgi:DNA polymerase-1